jgi:hypothetical protein
MSTGVESNMSWPCGQSSQLMRGCHRRRDLRHEARGGGYWFGCGPVRCFEGRYLTVGGLRPYLIDRSGVLALSFGAHPTEGRKGVRR